MSRTQVRQEWSILLLLRILLDLVLEFIFIYTNIMFLDIIHRIVFILKHNVSETGFCLRIHLKSIQLGTIGRASPYFGTPVPTPDTVYKPTTTQTICES
jgi:hypothetical protein